MLLCAGSGNALRCRPTWTRPIQAAWPAPAPPAVRCVPVATLLAILESERGPAAPDRPSACLLLFDRHDPAALIDRAVEAVISSGLPALCLLEDPAAWRAVQRRGILFEAWDAEPAMLAAMLYALGEHQQTVEDLSREISIAHRCQRGIRTEIERLHEELHLAASLQREFTSAPLPEVEGLDFAVLFRPVSFVSGDVYNVQPLGDGRAAFFLADAVGHGVPAALLTMVLTNSLAMWEPGEGGLPRALEPADVLTRLNRRLCDSCLGSGRFATAVYGVIDARTRRVTIAGAGHPSPVVLSTTACREVETEGPLLGVFPDAAFTQVSLTLGSRDTLLLVTDGFETAFPHPARARPSAVKRSYLEPISRLVTPDGRPSLRTVLAELGDLLDEQAGSLHTPDDVTALAIAPTAHADERARIAAA